MGGFHHNFHLNFHHISGDSPKWRALVEIFFLPKGLLREFYHASTIFHQPSTSPPHTPWGVGPGPFRGPWGHALGQGSYALVGPSKVGQARAELVPQSRAVECGQEGHRRPRRGRGRGSGSALANRCPNRSWAVLGAFS